MNRKGPEFIYSIGRMVMFIALAIASIFIQGIFIDNIRYFIGSLMIFYGVEQLAFQILFRREGFWQQGRNYLALVELILGITTLCCKLEFISICIMWATWSILRESYEFKEVILETKSILLTLVSGAESIAVIVFSVLLINTPTAHHALIHLFLLFFELLLTPIVPFLDVAIQHAKERKSVKSVQE